MKTLIVCKTHFLWHTNLQLVNHQVFDVLEIDTLQKPYFIVFLNTFLHLGVKELIMGLLDVRKKEDKKEKGD